MIDTQNVVELEGRIYNLDKTLELDSNTELYGQAGTVLRVANGMNQHAIWCWTGTNNVYLHDFKIDGNGHNQPEARSRGIVASRPVKNWRIERVEFYNMACNGISITHCEGLSIIDCVFHDFTREGSLEAIIAGGNGIIIKGNKIWNITGDNGITLGCSDGPAINVTCVRNIISGISAPYVGIVIFRSCPYPGSRRIQISYNLITNSYGGVWVMECVSEVAITRNLLYNIWGFPPICVKPEVIQPIIVSGNTIINCK